MAMAFLVTASIVLSLRKTIPRFLEEPRLLLHLGSIQEDERVMYLKLSIVTVLTETALKSVCVV
jgi:hypothetical protein